MRRISVFVTIALLAGFVIGYFTRSTFTGMLQGKARAADLAAIEKLHQKDIEVTLSQDLKAGMDIWTEDAVRLEPGSPPVVGKHAIQADTEKSLAPYPDFKVLSYTPDYKNIQIADGWAYEWGESDAKVKMSPEAPPVSLHTKSLRVLRRQSDGSWKIAVNIYNE
jgi:ketosteroid isomerase-like protein